MKNSLLITRFPYESSTGMGGEENHILSLIKGLTKKDYRVHLATSCPCLLKEAQAHKYSYEKVWVGRDLVSKIALLQFVFLGPLIFIKLAYYLIKTKRSHDIKVVYFLTLIEKICLTPVARIMGLKVIWGHHTKLGRYLTKNPFRLFYKLWSRMVTVVVPSLQMQKDFLKILPANTKFQIIPNGLDPECYPPPFKNDNFKEEILENLDLKYFKSEYPQPSLLDQLETSINLNNTKFIGTVSRLSPEKGLGDLLKAADKLLKIRQDCLFFVLGEGRFRGPLEEAIKKLELEKKFFLLGYQDYQYLVNFLHNIDLFVLPSPYESFGISILEAWYFKKPVIVARAGAQKNILEQRQTGLFFLPHNANDLAKNIEYLLDHSEMVEKISFNGQKLVLEKYMLEEIIKEWEKLISF